MILVELARLGQPERIALGELLARAASVDGHPPLPEPERHVVDAAGGASPAHTASTAHTAGPARAVLSHVGRDLVGAAFMFPARDGSIALHVVVDPDQRPGNGLALALVEFAVAEAGDVAPVHLWAMQAGPENDDLARALGFQPERDLLQMRVPLPLAASVVDATRHLPTRPFVPGRDEKAWVETNNRAFAGHPEQGGWTVAQLRERMDADWVDLDGFLVADAPDGDGLIGSCWTKVHRGGTPVLGEIYVISVNPRFHGQGWGRALTVAGLVSLASRGVPVGMLYVDATNESAVGLYRSLGFTVDHVDRSYRRDPAA
jgi:mycothiol synthase